jgi:predicted membrane protein
VRRRLVPQIDGALFAHARAQGLVEYGLILLMIVVVCVAIVTVIGFDVSEVWYQKIVNSWPQ